VKYTTDINAGLRDIATPNAIRVDNSRRGMAPMHGSVSGLDGFGSSRKHHSRPREMGGAHSSLGRSREGSAHGSRVGARIGAESTSKLMDPQQREMRLKEKQMDEIKRKQIAKAAAKRRAQKAGGKISKDADFEKMFGKDIDEFLEDSEWDIESMDKMSAFSRGSKSTIRSADQASKLRGLEKVYL